jgi:hypothetical protein
MLDFTAIRMQSLTTAAGLGYPVNKALPLLDQSRVTHSCDEVVDRILGMLSVAACAYGFDNQKAVEWLGRESKAELLTSPERDFLRTKVGDKRSFMEQIEGIWALAWSIGVVPHLDYGQPCAQDFVVRLPDLKGGKSSASFRDSARVRPDEEVVAACDLGYCLHWAIRDSQLRGMKVPGKVDAYVVIERRRALEWLLSDEDWKDVTLDT